MFKIGDSVEWSSSSAGTTKVKSGLVEAVIQAKKYPTDEQRKEADAYGIARPHVSYLVRVPGRTEKSKGKLYWPRVAALNGKVA